jgi:hypothetical protein
VHRESPAHLSGAVRVRQHQGGSGAITERLPHRGTFEQPQAGLVARDASQAASRFAVSIRTCHEQTLVLNIQCPLTWARMLRQS